MYSSVMSSFHPREKDFRKNFWEASQLRDVCADEMQGLQSTAGGEAWAQEPIIITNLAKAATLPRAKCKAAVLHKRVLCQGEVFQVDMIRTKWKLTASSRAEPELGDVQLYLCS